MTPKQHIIDYRKDKYGIDESTGKNRNLVSHLGY